MNEKWYKDILIQKHQADNYCDPTKIFILFGMTNKGLKNTYNVTSLSEEVYRLFISNPDIKKRNFNATIRNLEKYGIKDIKQHVVNVINQWIKEQTNSSVSMVGESIYLDIEDYGEETKELTRKMCIMLYSKYFKSILNPPKDYKYTCEYEDSIEEFGVSDIKSLILEDLQYCPLCEETDINKLFVVRILQKKETNNKENLYNKNNLLLMCKEEACDYMKGAFYFDEFGKIINVSSKIVNKETRLSISLINEERRNFITRHKQIIEARETKQHCESEDIE